MTSPDPRAPSGRADPGQDVAALAELARFPEMNPGPVVRLDRAGTVRLANTAARSLFGGGALIGSGWTELCPDMDPGMWQRVLASPVPVSCEAEVGERCVMFTFVRSEAGDSVFAFGTDITERRRAERELAEVARFPDMNPGPVLRVDLKGHVILANAAARRILGEDLVGRCWPDICPGMEAAAWRRITQAREPVPCEARLGDREYVFTHRRDHQGSVVFVFGADVTSQKQTERALRQSEKMATLGTLAAGVAHELNNPAAAARRAAEQLREAFARHEEAYLALGTVALSAEDRARLVATEARGHERAAQQRELDALLRADHESVVEEWLEARGIAEPWELAPALVAQGLDPPALEELAEGLDGGALAAGLTWISTAFPVHTLLHEIGHASARISEIVGALRSYSYLGQAPVQAVNLHEGLDHTLVILRSKLKVGITVRREYDETLPPVPAHGSELNQVWTNLLDNATDAMGGRGSITIRTGRRGDWAVVEIEDDGPGIPEEIQSRIFDPFFTTKAPGKGTGLGLSTSYGIVTEKHGGEMGVESRPGFTRFSVRLPIHPPAPDADGAEPRPTA